MPNPKPIATSIFTTSLISQGSWGATSLGVHESTMELFDTDDADYSVIEWDIPAIDDSEHIGLWFETRDGKRCLTDYDGVSCLPREAVLLLERAGVVVSDEFKE